MLGVELRISVFNKHPRGFLSSSEFGKTLRVWSAWVWSPHRPSSRDSCLFERRDSDFSENHPGPDVQKPVLIFMSKLEPWFLHLAKARASSQSLWIDWQFRPIWFGCWACSPLPVRCLGRVPPPLGSEVWGLVACSKQRQWVPGAQPCHWAISGYFWASWKNEAIWTSGWQCQLDKLFCNVISYSAERRAVCFRGKREESHQAHSLASLSLAPLTKALSRKSVATHTEGNQGSCCTWLLVLLMFFCSEP